MPVPIIAGLARIAATAARAAPAIARMAAGAAHRSPVGSGIRQSFRDVSHAAMRVSPSLEAIENFSGKVNRAADAIGGFTGATIKSINSLVTMPDKIARFGESVINAQRRLATLNGTMGVAQMRLEGQRFLRDLQMSRRTQGSFQQLTESQSRLEQTLLPYRAAVQNLTNVAASTLNVIADAHVRLGSAAFAGLFPQTAAMLMGAAGVNGPVSSLAKDQMNAFARGDYSKRRMPVLGLTDPGAKDRRLADRERN